MNNKPICEDSGLSGDNQCDRDVQLVTIRDQKTQRVIKQAHLCKAHRKAYYYAGYIVRDSD